MCVRYHPKELDISKILSGKTIKRIEMVDIEEHDADNIQRGLRIVFDGKPGKKDTELLLLKGYGPNWGRKFFLSFENNTRETVDLNDISWETLFDNENSNYYDETGKECGK